MHVIIAAKIVAPLLYKHFAKLLQFRQKHFPVFRWASIGQRLEIGCIEDGWFEPGQYSRVVCRDYQLYTFEIELVYKLVLVNGAHLGPGGYKVCNLIRCKMDLWFRAQNI